MERDPEAAPLVISWSRDRHLNALTDPNQAHLVVVESDQLRGFVLLAGVLDENVSIELRRIVLSPAGQGLGAQALELIIHPAFARLDAYRLRLNVKVHNHRAQRAYEHADFTPGRRPARPPADQRRL